MPEQSRIYEFGKKIDGDATMKALLGGKGANLAEMARIGLPVPPGFTITTEVCAEFKANGEKLPAYVLEQVKTAIKNVEAQQGKIFGDLENPLLFSIRSGARESMPGMMDTILNLGLNDRSVQGFARKTNNPRFAYDCYRRF
ncbi:MAG: pyruvate, phosphate dikinase, partial [Puniceicoccales bacterium]|nr:pyruvate, phosphate dikinase [Puniceicoccales bacterium]